MAPLPCAAPASVTVRVPEPRGLPSHARAIWLDAHTLRWPGQPGGADRYVLYAARNGGMGLSADRRVEGATDTLAMRPGPETLPATVRARTRHVGAGATMQLPANVSRRRVASLLRAQLMLVREDANGRVLEVTRTQTPLVLDDLYGAAESVPFGAHVTPGATTFRVWAPTAQAVLTCVYDAHGAPRAIPMTWEARTGSWVVRVPNAPHGTPYRYLVDVMVPGTGLVRNRVTDPWAVALTANSSHSVVADLSHPSLQPRGWAARRTPTLAHPTDQVLYELHVRDFSVSDETVPADHRGKYLAFTDTASVGMRHLAALARAGVTDVHLLPVFDLASVPEANCVVPTVSGPPDGESQQAAVMATAATDCYNWGYDPWHYTVPEGSYATDAADFAVRIREFRRMVMALNAVGLRVGMDVVYNHTSAAGQHEQSVLDRIVPGYYHRLNGDGSVETSTCCANTATEHRMMAKLMIESAATWVRAYGISSFRFDLMGHQPRAAMERLQRAVNRAAGRPVPLIGEGWNFGEVANGARFVQASQLALGGSGIGTFSDRARDAVRGGSALDDGVALVRNQGWANGLAYAPNAQRPTTDSAAEFRALIAAADLVRVGLAGTLRAYRMPTARGDTVPLEALAYGDQPAGYVHEPAEVVNYVENHDNNTLFDANVFKLPAGTTREDRARVQLLSTAVVLFSQGIAYLHAGQELLRSKSLDRNSFDSGDWFNRYDPTGVTHGFARGLPPSKDNAVTWPFMRPLLGDTGIVPSPDQVRWTREATRDLLRIRASSTLFRLRTARDVQQRLRFVNVGPAQVPTVVAATLDGRLADGALVPGAGFARLLYAINAGTSAQDIDVPELRGVELHLHPVLADPSAADARARTSQWERSRGVLRVPPRTAVVWVAR